MKRAVPILLAGVGLIVIALAIGTWQFQRFLHSPIEIDGDSVLFEISSGSSFTKVTRDLAAAGIIDKPTLFRIYGRLSKRDDDIQAGEYRLEAGTTPTSLLDQFVSGDVELYSFTIIEGWNHWEMLPALQAHPQVNATMTDEDWPALLDELGSDASYPEGLFLPETYSFPRNTSDRDILKQAYGLMQEALDEEWPNRQPDIPIKTPYEALVLASIVEKETARADERAQIAGVFVRRLGKRMRLQTDPTVIYGIGPAFNGNITRRDLRTDTPYNTYTRHGLPPTPIAMPGRDAIRAALNPEDGDTLYFVATGLGDGSHKFSVTKQEHDTAVAEYLKRLRQRRIDGN